MPVRPDKRAQEMEYAADQLLLLPFAPMEDKNVEVRVYAVHPEMYA